ncbi:hypothetical protein L3i20_v221610 [Paenibacillus sp. L3-i20]|nr:hypothetical protein L3i20_v221610 [Paenibacillus sp. L3-i20]
MKGHFTEIGFFVFYVDLELKKSLVTFSKMEVNGTIMFGVVVFTKLIMSRRAIKGCSSITNIFKTCPHHPRQV